MKIFIKLASDVDFASAVALLNMKQKNKYRNNLYFKSIDAKLRAVAVLNDANNIAMNEVGSRRVAGLAGSTGSEKQAIAIAVKRDTAQTRNKNHNNPSHLVKVSAVQGEACDAIAGLYKKVYRNTRIDFTAVKFMMKNKAAVVSAAATLKVTLADFEGVEIVYNRDNKSVIARVYF